MAIKKDNKGTAFDLFYSRIEYNTELYKLAREHKNIINMNFGEKYFYGRVNRSFVPILPDTTIIKTKSFKKNTDLTALNFVVNRFELLVSDYDLYSYKNMTAKTGLFVELKPVKAMIDPTILFSNHIVGISKTLKNSLTNPTKFTNMDEFIIFITPILERFVFQVPITLNAFLKSKHVPINASGLAVEIADIKMNNDQDKILKVINDPNFPLIADLANKYGFMIDMMNPSRLIADLSSEPMTQGFSLYGYKNTNELLNFGFSIQSTNSFLLFKQLILFLYNELKAFEVKKNDHTFIKPVKYTPSDIEPFENKLFNLYLLVRQIEEGKTFSYDKRPQNIISAVSKAEEFLCKPFDSPGSVSYKARANQQR